MGLSSRSRCAFLLLALLYPSVAAGQFELTRTIDHPSPLKALRLAGVSAPSMAMY